MKIDNPILFFMPTTTMKKNMPFIISPITTYFSIRKKRNRLHLIYKITTFFRRCCPNVNFVARKNNKFLLLNANRKVTDFCFKARPPSCINSKNSPNNLDKSPHSSRFLTLIINNLKAKTILLERGNNTGNCTFLPRTLVL